METLAMAEQTLTQLVDREPRNAQAHYQMGLVYLQQQRFQVAQRAFEHALRVDPLHAPSRVQLEQLEYLTGQAFQRPSTTPPQDLEAALRQASLQQWSHLDAIRKILEEASADSLTGPPALSQVHFALALLYDEVEQYEEAAEHILFANRIKRCLVDYEAARHTNWVNQIIQTFTPERLAAYTDAISDSERPIFIVGMPRSGTTLAEAILAAHPHVFAAGEIGAVSHLVLPLMKQWDYPTGLDRLDHASLRTLAATALHVLTRDASDAMRVTDKLPQQYRELGLIQILFPHARVIHCTRHPMDIGLSLFMNHFRDLHYTCDLDDIGRSMRDHERLMAHWKTVLHLRLLEVRYEDTVADLPCQAQRMLKFCGLDWSDACLEPHRAPHMVGTLSQMQVRRPVYATSVGRWRHYESMLEPLCRWVE